jgi:hypothetical protein
MSVSAIRVPAGRWQRDALEAWVDEAPRRGLFAVAAVSAVLIGVIAVFALHARSGPGRAFPARRCGIG